MKKKFCCLLVLFLVFGILNSPVCVQAKNNQGYTYVNISGSYDMECTGKAGIEQLNQVRAKAHKSPVIYSPSLEKVAREMVAAYVVAGKASDGRLKSPVTQNRFDVASICRKNVASNSRISFLSFAYSCNVASKKADVAKFVSGHSTKKSPGIYGAYPYGACVKFIPEGSKKAYFITVLCNQKGASIKQPTKQNVSYKLKVKNSYVSNCKKSSSVSKKKSAKDKSCITIKGAYEKLNVRKIKK